MSTSTPEYHSFPEEAFARTIETARQLDEGRDLRDLTQITPSELGTMELRAACISVTSGNHRVCLSIPIVGDICIPLPFDLPDGTALQACVFLRTINFGIPTGVCVRISAGGHEIVSRCFP
jgi:hypothetical protein